MTQERKKMFYFREHFFVIETYTHTSLFFEEQLMQIRSRIGSMQFCKSVWANQHALHFYMSHRSMALPPSICNSFHVTIYHLPA